MKKPVIIMGMGEMGGVFARAFLNAGHPVFPVLRQDDPSQIAATVEDPALVLLAVAERDFDHSMEHLPAPWRERLVLLQNELLPDDWKRHNVDNPTVISVWFEKKPGQEFKVLISSPVAGSLAEPVVSALDTLGIPAHAIADEHAMLPELVVKNLYILTTNICGLETGGTVSDLWNDNAILMNRVFDDVLRLQQHLTGQTFNRDQLLTAILDAFDGDPEHRCMGRSAPARLTRAMAIADSAGIDVPELQRIASQVET